MGGFSLGQTQVITDQLSDFLTTSPFIKDNAVVALDKDENQATVVVADRHAEILLDSNNLLEHARLLTFIDCKPL